MKPKVAFLAPMRDLAETVQRVTEELNEDITVFEGLENFPSAEELQKKEFEVIITCGPTVNKYRCSTNIPIIRCDPSDFDLFKAFCSSKTV